MLGRLGNSIFTHKGNKNSSSFVDYFIFYLTFLRGLFYFLFNVPTNHAEGTGILPECIWFDFYFLTKTQNKPDSLEVSVKFLVEFLWRITTYAAQRQQQQQQQ